MEGVRSVPVADCLEVVRGQARGLLYTRSGARCASMSNHMSTSGILSMIAPVLTPLNSSKSASTSHRVLFAGTYKIVKHHNAGNQ